ncbi:D-alanyl-D-alanine carboxypeptidase family protein [Pontibacillus yanchengensis]|uniref:D-alanyl-D-alanine carboxypeptidase family protein n=2 Tax=Pontibacillus yanchengensis TaxID=462910 RepID=A0ACC7VGC0_9BACI|nr:M15 family metallopeptidase [Pontibacillus yanchengensis]MYL32394.1 D-alanyl-D-alanine carboxypeptidase family protein [Pontibacillus yanchengensis]MYL52974.1 D-alanyl-D-alanine carboxypeptidase family protein [Pontibacillus yanchengensis]
MKKTLRTIMMVLIIVSLSACAMEESGDKEPINSSSPSERQSQPDTKNKPDDDFNEKQDSEDQSPDNTQNGDQTSVDENQNQTGEQNNSNPSNQENNDSSGSANAAPKDVVDDHTSVEAVINKQRQLPSGYKPSDLTVPEVPFYFEQFLPKKQMREEAASHLENLFSAASKQGLDLVAASGYRSYERQKQIYQSNVEAYGEERANQFSAQPGHSEHQTGLAMDVTVAQVSFKLVQEFGNTDEGDWLANHAHNYGFIIRYPKGKEDITGYNYEPWHLRYVGKEAATEIYNHKQTLEEYFGLVPEE